MSTNNKTDRKLIELLKQLVAIPSVNPKETDDDNITGEARLADFLAGYLERLGFQIVWDNKSSGRPNLLAGYGPKNPRQTLLFESHLDTVGVAGMVRPPFQAAIENGKLYGRGACDTKGPMAAILRAFSIEALDRLAEKGSRVVFAGVMGEETGNEGAERLVKKGIKADRVIVLEPTDLEIVHAHKGALWYEVEVRGVAAHGSDPSCGLNAVTGMAQLIPLLEQQIVEDQRLMRNELLGRPTLNIGMIRGGRAVNIVPDCCLIQIDRRTLPEEDTQQILETARLKLEDLQKRGHIASYEIRLIKQGRPFQTSAQSRLVGMLAESCLNAGIQPKTSGAAWYSDAGPLSKVCSEIVVFGPGSIRQAHTAEEYIDLNRLQDGCNILKDFLKGLAAEPG